MQRFQKFSKKVADKLSQSKAVVLGGATLIVTTASQAAITAPTYDVASVETVATAVLGALALIWVIKKAMSVAR